MDDENDVHQRVSLRVSRLTYTESNFRDEFKEIPEKKITISRVGDSFLKLRLRSFGFAILPAIMSLPSFFTLKLFLLDVISGLTMAIFHVPQGLVFFFSYIPPVQEWLMVLSQD